MNIPPILPLPGSDVWHYLFLAALCAITFLLVLMSEQGAAKGRAVDKWLKAEGRASQLAAQRLELRTGLRLARHMLLSGERMDTRAGQMFADLLGEAWEPLAEEFYRSPKAGKHFAPTDSEQRDHCAGGCCSHGGTASPEAAADLATRTTADAGVAR